VGDQFHRPSGEIAVGFGTVEVIHHREHGPNHFGHHCFSIGLTISFNAHPEVLKLRFGASRPIAVFRNEVALGICQQFKVFLGEVVL
jgi:hypothetical protein